MKERKKPRGSSKQFLVPFHSDMAWENLENLQAVLQNSPLSIIVIDTQTNVRMWNPAAEKLFGWKADEILGKPYPLVPPDEEKQFRKQLKEGCGGTIFTNLHARRRRKDSVIVDVSISSTVLKNKQRKIIGFLGLLEDITERLRVEEKLRSAIETQKAMIQASPLSIIVLDTQSRVTLWNPAAERMFGWKEKEVLGKPAPNVPDEEKQVFAANIKKLMGGETFTQMEIRPRRKDGTVFDAQISSAILRDSNGGIAGFMGIFEDITEKKHSLEILRMSEEKYRLLVETMSDGLGIIDENGLITYVNDELCKIFGRGRNEMLGKSPAEFLDEASRKIFKEQQSKRKKGKSSTYELTWVRKNGEKVITIVSANALMDSKGHFKGAFAVMTDITKQKHSEDALRESAEKLSVLAEEQRMLLEQARDFVYRHDAKGVFNYMSPSVETITGHTVEDWLKHYTTYMTDHPLNKDVIRYTEATLKTGKESPSYFVEIYHKRGHRVMLEVSERPYFEKGKVAGIVGIARDVSERHKIQEALKASEERYRSLVSTAQDVIFTLSGEGILTSLNPSFETMTGWSCEEWIGRHFSELIHPDDMPYAAELFKRGQEGELFPVFELRVSSKSGEFIFAEFKASPIFANGKIKGAFGIARDIRERKKAEEALKTAHEHLEKRVEERTVELSMANAVLKKQMSDRKRMEDALRESEARLRAVIDAEPACVKVLEADGTLLEMNASGLSMVQAERVEDVIGKSVYALIAPEHQTALRALHEMVHSGKSGSLQFELIGLKGRRLWMETHAVPLRHEKNGNTLMLAITHDITERKQAEDALRESEARYRALSENTPQGIWQITPEGYTLYANPAMCELLEIDEQNALEGKTYHEFFTPESLEKIKTEGIKREKGVSSAYEVELTGKRGGKRNIMLSGAPLFDADGKLHSRIGTFTDITERKKYEEELKKTLSLLGATLESTADGILVVGEEGKIASFNQRFVDMWNLSAHIIEARDDDKAIAFVIDQLKEPEKFVKKIRELYAAPEAESYDILEFKDGKTFERFSMPQKLGENVVGRVWSFRDVTERRRAEKLLQYRLDFENLVAVLSTSFINLSPGEVDSGIDFALRAIGEFAGADRSYIFQYGNEDGLLSNTHEWCAPDITPQFQRLQNMNMDRNLSWFSQKMKAQDYLYVPSVEDLPSEASAEKKHFLSKGTRSFVAVSMICGGAVVGFVGFDAVHEKKEWSDEVVALLKIVGDIFVNALERKKTSELLKVNEEQYRLLFESHPHPMWIFDLGTLNFLAVNEAAVGHYGYSREEFLAMTMKDIRPAEDVAVFLEHVAESRFPDIDFEGTRRHLKRDGTVIHVEITSREILFAGKRAKVVMATDVTERKQSQEALRENVGKLRMLTEKMPAILWSTDTEFAYTSQLGSGLANLQLLPNEAVGTSLYEYFQTEDTDFPAISAHRRALTGESVTYDMHWMGRVYNCHVEPLRDAAGQITGCIGVALDITDQKQAEETVQHQAYHDALTGLPNRLLFNDRLAIEISHAYRKKERLAVLFLDLDRFKTINDTLGHAVGDQLLQGAAGRLISHLSDDSTIARLGGDEFMILITDVKNVEDVTREAKKVLEAFKLPWLINSHELHITTSVGIAMYPDDGEDVETLVRNADTAMYRAKQQGRNNYQLYAPAMNVKAFEQLVMENSLRRALDRKEFVVHYQPQVNIRTGEITGVEALLRWQHPDLGLIFPANFIPLAEETGLIVSAGEWVLRTACAQNKMWQNAGLPPVRMSVNLAARQFQQKDLVEMVANVLAETQLSPRYLDIEITESIAMDDPDITLLVLRELTAQGIRISIDDFGTGYSSLSYLKMFPIHTLKIDQSFVRDITTDPNDAAIATAIIVLGHSLKLRVLAEGVEAQEQLAFLKQQNCDEIQGFLFGRPVSAEEIQPVLMQKFIRVR